MTKLKQPTRSDDISFHENDVGAYEIATMCHTGKGMGIVRQEKPYKVGEREGKKRDGIAPPADLLKWRIECVEKGLPLWTPLPLGYA